jgi:hypothetical protein
LPKYHFVLRGYNFGTISDLGVRKYQKVQNSWFGGLCLRPHRIRVGIEFQRPLTFLILGSTSSSHTTLTTATSVMLTSTPSAHSTTSYSVSSIGTASTTTAAISTTTSTTTGILSEN